MARPTPPSRLGGRTILVVEDDEDLLALIVLHLEHLGAEVSCARTASSAREALASSTFDLLLSDLHLPDGSGHDLAREARRDARVRAAVALTGDRSDDAVTASHGTGFVAHVTKPCDLETLARVAEAATRRP